MFEKYGVPASGWAPGVTRPTTERSGTLVNDLGPNQLHWLRNDMKIFADANRRAEQVKAHTAEVAASFKPSAAKEH